MRGDAGFGNKSFYERHASARRSGFSLKNKIVLLAGLCAMLSALLVGAINYYRIEKIVLNTSLDSLAGDTRLMAQRFRFSFDQLKSDVQVLSQTPPVQGIVRGNAYGGIDPVDGSSTEIWRARLASIFKSMLAARPDYTQIRYIGIDDGGRELVRTNRLKNGVEVVSERNLQKKGGEPYFLAGLATPRNRVHFSEVSYNRERGAVDSALVPTIRVVMPVFDASGAMFGMMVINANYEQLLRRAFEEIGPQKNTFVLNNSGDYIEYDKTSGIGPFEFHSNYSAPPPEFVKEVLRDARDEQSFVTSDAVSYFVRLKIDPGNPDAFMGVVVRVPYDDVMGVAGEARRTSLIWGGALILASMVGALIMARSFTAPLARLASEIRKSDRRGGLENLPLEREDEIGELARALDTSTRELADNEARLSAIVDNTADGLVTINKRGKIELFNQACERILGFNANEVIGRDVRMFVPELANGGVESLFEKSRGNNDGSTVGRSFEVEGRRKDGEAVPLELSISQVQIADTKVYSLIIRDISERKRMDIIKDEFISTVNHELRTPLTSIQGSLGLLMSMAGSNFNDKSNKLLRLSHDSCQRLTRLVNDILDMERIAAGKVEYSLEVVEICELVRSVVERQQAYADKYGVEYQLHFEVPEAFVRIDRDRFDQALVNLLSNAAKFSHDGGIAEVRVAMPSLAEVSVSVRDYGEGIPESFYDRIFGKFAQAESPMTRKRHGSGLGLNITKGIIEAFDGSVTFTSQEGVGSEFTFTLPAYEETRLRA